MSQATFDTHTHNYLGGDHARSERKTWAVIALCTATMVAEIVGGLLFGSIALVADGLHMSTHAGALLLAALAYWFARRHVSDERFTFGTGKLGDLAGFANAIVLAVVAILVGYEAVSRFFAPADIHFAEALPIATLGLAVNLASVWLLSGHSHSHNGHSHDGHNHDGHGHGAHDHGEREHAAPVSDTVHRDNNMRAAVIHVIADAAVSVLVIVGLGLAWLFHWTWMDPLAGLIGAIVIASWSLSLIRDTGAILLDMNPDRALTDTLRRTIERDGDQLIDFHLWRLGPGHLGAIVSVVSRSGCSASHYRERLARFRALSHVTVEVLQPS